MTAEAPALVARDVSKRFGAVEALAGVSLDLKPMVVHAVLGENGAGKSTLVGVLNGLLAPDSGDVLMGGEPTAAGAAGGRVAPGVATVFQHLALVPSMTGFENLRLALDGSPEQRIREVDDRFGISAPLDVPVSALEMPQRQRVALIRALAQKPRVLILDEPTTFLPPTEIDPFLDAVRGLADQGLAVMLITHRLSEVRRVADWVTVLRRGRVVARYSHEELPDEAGLAAAMVGAIEARSRGDRPPVGEPVLEVEGLSVGSGGECRVRDVSLQVREGEIVGIAGVDGNGQVELLEGIAGLLADETEGTVRLDGTDLVGADYAERLRSGIVYLSGDRSGDGIVPMFSIEEHFRFAGITCEGDLVDGLKRYGVDPPLPGMRADRLSGGNQQKVLLARALMGPAKVLVTVNPTQGLDVRAVRQLHRILREEAAAGRSVLIWSSDLDELMHVAHRVLVMRRGEIAGEQIEGAFDARGLAQLFIGEERVWSASAR